MDKRNLNKMVKFDAAFPDGRFTAGKNLYPNLDMRGLMNYCKKNNIPYDKITEEDFERYNRPKAIAKQ